MNEKDPFLWKLISVVKILCCGIKRRIMHLMLWYSTDFLYHRWIRNYATDHTIMRSPYAVYIYIRFCHLYPSFCISFCNLTNILRLFWFRKHKEAKSSLSILCTFSLYHKCNVYEADMHFLMKRYEKNGP